MNDAIQYQTLDGLAGQINAEHRAAQQAARKTITHVLKAGELLIEAKAKVQHGEWLSWLQQNCTFSERTAQTYMRVAREYPKLDEVNAQRVADFSLRQALRSIAPAKIGADVGGVWVDLHGNVADISEYEVFAEMDGFLLCTKPPTLLFSRDMSFEQWKGGLGKLIKLGEKAEKAAKG